MGLAIPLSTSPCSIALADRGGVGWGNGMQLRLQFSSYLSGFGFMELGAGLVGRPASQLGEDAKWKRSVVLLLQHLALLAL